MRCLDRCPNVQAVGQCGEMLAASVQGHGLQCRRKLIVAFFSKKGRPFSWKKATKEMPFRERLAPDTATHHHFAVQPPSTVSRLPVM